jgi:outer membrane protein
MNMRLFALAAFGLASAPSFAIDLVESYSAARAQDPTLLAAEQSALAGREKAVQGAAGYWPQVSLSASLTHMEDKSGTDLPEPLDELIDKNSSGAMHDVQLQLKQSLYDAKLWAESDQADEQTALSAIQYRDAQQDLISRVSEAYFDLLYAQQSLAVTQAEKKTIGTQLERAQARFDVGKGKITDVQDAQARYDGVVAREVSDQATLAMREAQYEALTGVPAQGLAGLRADFVPQLPQPNDLRAWQAKGLETNAYVLSKKSELAIAKAEIEKYKLTSRPTLDLVASVSEKGMTGGSSDSVIIDDSRTATVGLQLTIPLFAGGAIDSKMRESVAKLREAELDVAAAQRDTRLKVQDAFLAMSTGVARIAALEQSVKSAEIALESTNLGRDVGTRTEPDVLDAQQRLHSAQLDLAKAQNDYLLGTVQLASSVGQLGESDLAALNAVLAR